MKKQNALIMRGYNKGNVNFKHKNTCDFLELRQDSLRSQQINEKCAFIV